MNERRKIYWDSSCFICLLNKAEADRRRVCEDVIRHAQNAEFDIWTSTWTIVEVIRPKKKYGIVPRFPLWTVKAFAAAPEGRGEFQALWDYYYKNTSAPSDKLTPEQIAVIAGMFEWPCIKTAYLDQRVASKAVELSRDFGLKPPDAVHAATAILAKVAELQRWDRDFDKVAHLIPVENPKMITRQEVLIPDFQKPVVNLPESTKEEKKP